MVAPLYGCARGTHNVYLWSDEFQHCAGFFRLDESFCIIYNSVIICIFNHMGAARCVATYLCRSFINNRGYTVVY